MPEPPPRVTRQGAALDAHHAAFDLAKAAERIVQSGRSPVPCADRGDELGDLARVLLGWQDAVAARDVLIEQAPIAICIADSTGRLTRANGAAQSMLGFSEKELLGRSALDLVHRSDVAEAMRIEPRVQYGGPDQVDFEGRLVGRDGATTWCTAAVAPIDLRDGHAEAYVLILEDITEHRRQQEFAATIQRRLLPQAPPTLPGYRLAGACLPAQEVAGDLGDWSLTASGSLDITVADVMGKGMAAALVTARVRTALTATRASLFGFVAGPTRAPRLASRPCEQTSELTRSAIGPGPC